MQMDVQAASDTRAQRQRTDESPGGPSMLGDATVVVLLTKEAFRRVGGVTSLVGMAIATGVLVRTIHRIAAPGFRRFRPKRPSFAGTVIAMALGVEPLRGIAGGRAGKMSFAGPLIAISMAVPVVRRMGASAVVVRAGFRVVRTALSLDPPQR
jgi:hypothetical protein